MKTLFALSTNTCAFMDLDRRQGCEERLTDPSWKKVKARICHICGLRMGSARYEPSMTDAERNAYSNLILLCPNHHTTIDETEPHLYSVRMLTEMKRVHEERAADAALWSTEQEREHFTQMALRQMQPYWSGAFESVARSRDDEDEDEDAGEDENASGESTASRSRSPWRDPGPRSLTDAKREESQLKDALQKLRADRLQRRIVGAELPDFVVEWEYGPPRSGADEPHDRRPPTDPRD